MEGASLANFNLTGTLKPGSCSQIFIVLRSFLSLLQILPVSNIHSTYLPLNYQLQKQKNRTLKRCIFRQIQANNGYFEFESVKYPQWFIGFSKGGVPIKGSRSSRRQKPRYRQFLVISLRPEKKRRNHLKRAIQYNELKKRIIRLLRMKLRLWSCLTALVERAGSHHLRCKG